ncbi:MAG: hypothetical protein J6Z14_04450 [Prevotella sp.]|nr:hypothetical protein [Prevotella sp.]
MKETRNILAALFALICAIALALYIGGEFMDMDIAVLSDVDDGTRFVLQTVAILLSLAVVPLSLKLFSIQKVRDDLLERKAAALKKWGTLRLLMLGTVLVGNTLLYYLLAYEPAFGYLAIITALALPFVMPTMRRCLAETSQEPADNE